MCMHTYTHVYAHVYVHMYTCRCVYTGACTCVTDLCANVSRVMYIWPGRGRADKGLLLYGVFNLCLYVRVLVYIMDESG